MAPREACWGEGMGIREGEGGAWRCICDAVTAVAVAAAAAAGTYDGSLGANRLLLPRGGTMMPGGGPWPAGAPLGMGAPLGTGPLVGMPACCAGAAGEDGGAARA